MKPNQATILQTILSNIVVFFICLIIKLLFLISSIILTLPIIIYIRYDLDGVMVWNVKRGESEEASEEELLKDFR